MKIDEKAKKRMAPQEFSGRVEISVTGIDKANRRMTTGYRRSLRVSETTVEEVFNVVSEAIIEKAEG